MPEHVGKLGRHQFVAPQNLQAGGETNTSGEVVMLGMPRRFVAPSHLQAGGGLRPVPRDRGGLPRVRGEKDDTRSPAVR